MKSQETMRTEAVQVAETYAVDELALRGYEACRVIDDPKVIGTFLVLLSDDTGHGVALLVRDGAVIDETDGFDFKRQEAKHGSREAKPVLGPGPSFPEPVKVQFDTTDYERAHGRAPRGRGGWAFVPYVHRNRLNYLDFVFWAPSGTYSEARRLARSVFAWLGYEDVAVCS